MKKMYVHVNNLFKTGFWVVDEQLPWETKLDFGDWVVKRSSQRKSERNWLCYAPSCCLLFPLNGPVVFSMVVLT